MKAVIMAGGEGSRLRPLTCDRPKPMVPVMDKPIMEHIIQLLYRHNLHNIGVTLMYLPEEIKDYFGDGSEFGVKLEYFIEETPLGTAGSVKNGEKFLDESFLVISGDALTDFDLTNVIRYHQDKKAAVTIVLTRVANPLEYGVVITDTDGRIRQFLEKPSWGEVFSDTVNTGIYVIEPEILNLIPKETPFDFSKDLFPMLLKEGYPMYGCVMPGYWCDIGNLTQYQQAHLDILCGNASISIPGTKLTEGIWVGKGTEIHPDARLEPPVFLGNDVKIGKDVFIGSYSVVGSNSILEEGVSLKRSIVWNNVFMGKKATLRGTTVCNRVKIKSHAATYEGSVIGDDTVLDEYTSVKPGVKIWPYKSVDKGTVLNESLIWASQVRKNLFGMDGISGEINIEMTPEIATKLGAAYGSILKKQSQVTISADSGAGSQMIKNSISVGLLSTGCHILDLGQVVTPISCYGVRTLGVNGGVHVSTVNKDEKVYINFFNNKGINISKNDQRKIENVFFREDFRRVTASQIRLPSVFPNLTESYYQDMMKQVDVTQLRKAQLKILLNYDRVNFGDMLPQFLESLGCEIILFDRQKYGNSIRSQADQVTSKKYDLGAMISSDGEQLILIDSSGIIIQEDLFTALMSLILLKANKPCTLVVPITASRVIEQIAARFDGNVIRTKTSRQFFMEKALDDQVIKTQKVYKQFKLHFDAIYAFVCVLEYLAKEETNLSQLVGMVPRFFLSRKDIACPWNAKGTVMRKLIEEHNERTELLDGIKVYHENGWALVLPDSEEPVCRIFGEGTSMEIAEDLTAFYADKVNNFKKES
ncbi:MAG: sugar phosphate nucleotidyltransferase [Bacillota bacterium]|jgi:mannose-1-phosphate guanylyltransferase/phosphomannomutase